jgi:hypothetical protein
VRAISQQSTRQLSTLRPSASSRIAVLQSSKPTLCRPFHQSRIWRAEEDKKEHEALKDDAAAVAEETQEAAVDPAVKSAAAEAPVVEPVVAEEQEVAEVEAMAAPDAAQAAAAAASSAPEPPSNYPPEPPQPTRFPPNDIPTGSHAAPSPTRILYVGNLFFEVTGSQLEAEFGRYGAITNSRIVTDARGLSKGFGYVEFSEQSAADQAVRELDQKVFQGRRMAVQFHVRRERRPMQGSKHPNTPSKTLFIGNMSYQMSDRDLNGKIAVFEDGFVTVH